MIWLCPWFLKEYIIITRSFKLGNRKTFLGNDITAEIFNICTINLDYL